MNTEQGENKPTAQLVYCASTGNTSSRQRSELIATSEESAQGTLGYIRSVFQAKSI